MLNYPPAAADVFVSALAAEFSALYGRGRRILGVDATHGTGFADRLAGTWQPGRERVFRADLEDFQRPSAERAARGSTGSALYFDRYDYGVLLRVLIEPFLLGGSTSFVTAAFDAGRDRQLEPVWRSAPDDAVLILSGPFLQRPELRGRFHFTVYLDETPPREESWAEALELYEAQAQPRRAAQAVVDYRDPEHPRRVFLDAC